MLMDEGIESWIVDPTSIATSRRRAKTDKIDGEALVRALLAFKRGEPRVCAMLRVPTPEEEDRRRIGRERKTLIAERIEHVNRIKGLLFSQGVFDYEPMHRDRRTRLDELRTGDGRLLPRYLKAQVSRELDRLELLIGQIKAVEASRNALVTPGQPAIQYLRKWQAREPERDRPGIRQCAVFGRTVPALRQLQASSGVFRVGPDPVAERFHRPRARCVQGGQSAPTIGHGRTRLAMDAASTGVVTEQVVPRAHED